jgi:hypothetical protein
VRAPIDRETVSPAFIAEVLALKSLEAGDNFATYESVRPEAMNGSGKDASNAPGTGNL